MAYTFSNTDATNFSTRISDLLNKTAADGKGVDIAGCGAKVAVAGGTLLQQMPLAAADAILDCVGYRGSSEVVGGVDSRGANTFADVTVGYGTWSPTIPVAKTYELLVNLSCYMAGAADTVYFQVMVGGIAVVSQPVYAASFMFNALNQHARISWSCPIAFAATGAQAISLQWKTTAVGTVHSDASDFRQFVLRG